MERFSIKDRIFLISVYSVPSVVLLPKTETAEYTEHTERIGQLPSGRSLEFLWEVR